VAGAVFYLLGQGARALGVSRARLTA